MVLVLNYLRHFADGFKPVCAWFVDPLVVVRRPICNTVGAFAVVWLSATPIGVGDQRFRRIMAEKSFCHFIGHPNPVLVIF